MAEHTLAVGNSYSLNPYFRLEVKQLPDGVYPFVTTAPAINIIPWRVRSPSDIEVCLLVQDRADTTAEEQIKAIGGYKKAGESDSDAAVRILRSKFGFAPDEYQITWWRECRGCGPAYHFQIMYGYLRDPKKLSDVVTAKGCSREWFPLEEVLEVFTTKGAPRLWDDFTLSMLTILKYRWREM